MFLAAKTTNYPVPLDVFTPKFKGLTQQDILDTEFLLAQSLGFEFWVRGAEKAFRGWGLEFQVSPLCIYGDTVGHILTSQSVASQSTDTIQQSLPKALEYLAASRSTDLEFTHSPSQISLAAWYLASSDLVLQYLEGKYDAAVAEPSQPEDVQPFGATQANVVSWIKEVAEVIKAAQSEMDLKKVKEVDKRLKGCTNPEKVPGSAL